MTDERTNQCVPVSLALCACLAAPTADAAPRPPSPRIQPSSDADSADSSHMYDP